MYIKLSIHIFVLKTNDVHFYAILAEMCSNKIYLGGIIMNNNHNYMYIFIMHFILNKIYLLLNKI